VDKPNSVIVYGYNKYFFGAIDSTDRINFSNQQLYSVVRLDGLQCAHCNIASKKAFFTGVPER